MQVFYILILLIVHPFYISTTEITLKEEKHDIKIKIFRDDLEDGLRLFFDKSISIDTELKLENRSSQVADYIKDKFQISVNKSEIIMLGILALLVIFFGFYPVPLMETLNVSVDNLINNYEIAVRTKGLN